MIRRRIMGPLAAVGVGSFLIMRDRKPVKIEGGSFGKRSAQPPTGPRNTVSTQHEDEPSAGGSLTLPKWLIGGVAAMFLFALVAAGTGGGGGFFGGLLGGLLANKLFSKFSSSPSTATAQRAPAAPTHAAAPSSAGQPSSVSRGGFGGTTSSGGGSSWSFGG